MTSSSSSFEIRLFYVRISPCSIDTVPSSLTLSHLRRPIGVCLEINGAKIPSSDPTSLLLRRDRIDRETSEVTYVSTDGVKLTGAVDFEVCDDQGNLILCGSLEKMEAAWSNGSIGSCGDKDPKTGWSMDCYLAASIDGSGFLQPKLGIVSPLIEVYVAGCFSGVPLILTQTVQVSPRRKARPGALDAIPEDEEGWERANARSDGGLVCRRSTATLKFCHGLRLQILLWCLLKVWCRLWCYAGRDLARFVVENNSISSNSSKQMLVEVHTMYSINCKIVRVPISKKDFHVLMDEHWLLKGIPMMDMIQTPRLDLPILLKVGTWMKMASSHGSTPGLELGWE